MKKILLISDNPNLYTGFGKVTKYISLYLYKLGYQVKVIGWFSEVVDKDFLPFDIIKTDIQDRKDKYGKKTFNKVIDDYRPDLVIAIGDEWMVRHTVYSEYRDKYKLILYIPIDGSPIPSDWLKTFKGADKLVVFGNFAEKQIKLLDNNIDLIKIPHGVDIDIYHPISNVHRPRKELENKFLIGYVSRNQLRKRLPRLMKAFSMFIQSVYSCQICGSISFYNNQKRCEYCESEMIEIFPSKDDVFLYLHCSQYDLAGWDIIELSKRLNISNKVIYPQNNIVGRGVSERKLAYFYNMFDVFTLPTSGEGFGLTILEAMACGVPCLVTDYSGHMDYCRDVVQIIKVSEYITEAKTNIERAIVDINDYIMKLDSLYYDKENFVRKWRLYQDDRIRKSIFKYDKFGKELRDYLGELALERAKGYSWDRILLLWKDVIEKMIGISTEKRKKIKLLEL